MQRNVRLILAAWFGFFGSFLIGASLESLKHYPGDRFVVLWLVLYGLLFFGFYPVLVRPRLLKFYCRVMTLGALAMSVRLAYVAAKRPSAYQHWDDWLLLAFLLLGMWSLLPALWHTLKQAKAAPQPALPAFRNQAAKVEPGSKPQLP